MVIRRKLTPVLDNQEPDTRFHSRLDKDRWVFLPSSVTYSKLEWKRRLASGKDNHFSVLKPKKDIYTKFPSLLRNNIDSEDYREDIYDEINSRKRLDRALTSWQNTKYLPPIILGKSSSKRSVTVKKALTSDIALCCTSKVKISSITTTHNPSLLLSSDVLNVNPVVLSEKPKRPVALSRTSL